MTNLGTFCSGRACTATNRISRSLSKYRSKYRVLPTARQGCGCSKSKSSDPPNRWCSATLLVIQCVHACLRIGKNKAARAVVPLTHGRKRRRRSALRPRPAPSNRRVQRGEISLHHVHLHLQFQQQFSVPHTMRCCRRLREPH